MPRFAANLSFLYQEVPLLERYVLAAQDGFQGVEMLFPYAWDAQQIADLLAEHQLIQVLFNAPAGNWEAGERGLASLAGREGEFRRSMDLALDTALQLGTKRLHVMAGLRQAGVEAESQWALYRKNLSYAAQHAAAHGISILVEPLNARDMPGYLLSTQAQAHALCQEIGAQNLKVQCDLYHAQITEGDLSTLLKQGVPGGRIGHIQIANVPHRNEPVGGQLSGEIHYPYLFALLDELGYGGWVGCEYRPATTTREGLGWLYTWQAAQATNASGRA